MGICFSIVSVGLDAITAMQVTSMGAGWRVQFTVTGPAPYRGFLLSHPARVVLDLDAAWRVRAIPKGYPIMRTVRAWHQQAGTRIVLDMTAPVSATFFALRPQHGQGYRVIIDMHAERAASVVDPRLESAMPINPVPVMPSVTAVSKPVRLQSPARSRNIIVVIDPGHGGRDSGARGQIGTCEKDVVLAISRQLYTILNATPGYSAYLTRNADYYLTLRQRLAVGRRDKADLFVAIHADAYRNTTAHGASVFALSVRGATSEAARWLARRENESELMGGVELPDQNDVLKSVLLNLSQTATVNTSLEIGMQLLDSLSRVSTLHHRRVEQAAFVVLKSPDIPSLLVETGFVSHRSESQRLADRAYQQQLAYAIAGGINRYFVRHPPRGTFLADRR
ncbi:MAG: hypothetical protein A3J38_01515 [Gammaproteobacteria bacterium RIFCSPHIGHO2_12_FULL_45_9]|nr:MAG: hypothetical protein A3J38_01515 [Gammaproteobacteria bacterium RIFCSPHIGHO2_12_FULL_45_9]